MITTITITDEHELALSGAVESVRDFLAFTRRQDMQGLWIAGVEQYAGKWIVDIHKGSQYIKSRNDFETYHEAVAWFAGFAVGLAYND